MNEDRIARENERREITGVSRAQWYRLERQGKAPKRLTLGPNSVGWRLSDLQRWIRTRTPSTIVSRAEVSQ